MGLPGITKAQMVEVDRLMTQKYKVPIEIVMEQAGLNLAKLCIAHSTSDTTKFVAIVGSSNNGGGGIVAAKRLASWGYNSEIHLVKGRSNLNSISQNQLRRAQHLVSNVYEGLPEQKGNLKNREKIYIDAYLGYGFEYRSDNTTEDVFHFYAGCPNVISLDAPSGLDVTTGEVFSKLHPIATLTLAFVKFGLLIADSISIGKLYVADIGVPNLIFKNDLNIRWIPPLDVKMLKKLGMQFSCNSILEVKIKKNQENIVAYWEI